jgi:hypothetical protein
MALLRSVNNVPNIDYYEYRGNNFYNKYTYRAKFKIDGLRYANYVSTPEQLDKRLSLVNQDWFRANLSDLEKIKGLKNFIVWRNTHRKLGSVTVRVEGDASSIYSDDLDLLLTLKDLGLGTVKITEAQLEQFAGTKYYVDTPKHNYRIYLKSTHIKDVHTFINDINNTFKKSKELFPSNALKVWINEYLTRSTISQQNWRYRWTNGNHSIDYDNESTLSYLMLMYGHILGKRYKLEKRPELV